jgi:hypothetical protein
MHIAQRKDVVEAVIHDSKQRQKPDHRQKQAGWKHKD